MKSVVVAYEDQYCEELHRLVKALRRDAGQPGLVLEPRAVRGTGNFADEVQKLLRLPLKQTKQPPDRVVCVADGDRPQNLVPTGAAAPTSSSADILEQWVIDFEKSWKDFLVQRAQLGERDAARLFVVCLRWSKESLLTASPEALVDRAGERRSEIESFLNTCDPRPESLPDEDFMRHYRTPQACLDKVFERIAGRRYKKGRDDEDLLRDWVSPHPDRRARLLRRCPDLTRLLVHLGPASIAEA